MSRQRYSMLTLAFCAMLCHIAYAKSRVLDFTEVEEYNAIEDKQVELNFDVIKVNDDEKALDGYIRVYGDSFSDNFSEDDIVLNLKTYVLKNNRYQETNFNLDNAPFCDRYVNDEQMCGEVRKSVNSTDQGCPVQSKTTYKMTEFQFNTDNLPENFPEGSYKVEVVMSLKPSMLSVAGANIYFDYEP